MIYKILSDNRSTSVKEIKLEGTFDEHNLSRMRAVVSKVVSRFLRHKINGHVLVHKEGRGVVTCEATITVNFPEYDERII